MNIDFHYGVIYLLARIAEYPPARAKIVAHACQYVDDATTDGMLDFLAGESFERFASAHDMIDYQNLDDHENRPVWIPFHFLPGGEGNNVREKAICRPNSRIAQEMVRAAIRARSQANGLHRLGVTLHVYIDTWAHQGFSGIHDPANEVRHLEATDVKKEDWRAALGHIVSHAFNLGATQALSKMMPLGHGAALSNPDLPWVSWEYENGHGEKVKRENPVIFLEAADRAVRVLRAFMHGNEDFMGEEGLSEEQANQLLYQFMKNQDSDAGKRLASLNVAAVDNKLFDLQESIPPYVAKGPGSWKEVATGLHTSDDGDTAPVWQPAFESSDYRYFHDAVKEHRMLITHQILPEFGIRLA